MRGIDVAFEANLKILLAGAFDRCRSKGVSVPGFPCEEEAESAILQSWADYFKWLRIEPEEQCEEFNGIMRARVLSGITSLWAPEVGSL